TPATIDVEKVVLLKPDIVFVCSGTNGVDVILMKKLRLYGLRTFALRCDSAKELKNIVEDIEAVGKMFNVEDKALQIIERLGEELSWVENKLKDSYRPKVLKL
ncbi:MAG: ABC transporter substrate-binding protein, partial [candidate division WOR-3 bacterium]